MNEGKLYTVNPVVSFGREEDGAVLYNPDTDSTSVINLTGCELWNILQTPHTEDEIVDHLVNLYNGAAVEQVRQDTQVFIETLIPDFLLEVDGEN